MTIGRKPTSQQIAQPASNRLNNELDQYDLLNGDGQTAVRLSDNGALPEANLSATARAFNSRIQRKKREQEKLESAAEQATKIRQALMIKALNNIRRALSDLRNIDLGLRFSLNLVADDYHGWPRLTVRLHDSLQPRTEYPVLQVTAHDRQARGAIELKYHPTKPIESISLTKEQDLLRFPAVVRRCVRSYLDIVEEIVLEAERRAELSEDEALLQQKTAAHFHEEERKADGPELSGDLFDEDFNPSAFETLPSMGEVASLPDVVNFEAEIEETTTEGISLDADAPKEA